VEEAEGLASREILEANADLEERLSRLSFSVSYDEEFDIFVLTIGEPTEAITEEVADGLQLRLDPETLKVVGFEVLSFRRRFLPAHPEFGPHFESLFESPIQRRDIPPRGAQHRRAQEVASKLAAVS